MSVALSSFILGYFGGGFRKRPLYAHGREHVMVIGPTGSGKTAGLIIPNAVTCDDSMIILDVKHEVYQATSGFRQTHGHRCVKIAFGEPDGISHQWNPFYAVPDSRLHRTDALQKIADMWVEKGIDENPIWPGGARAVFVGVALLIWDLLGKKALTPGEMYRFVHAPVHLQSFIALLLWKHGERLDPGVARLLGSLINKPDKTFGSIIETLATSLKMFENPVLDIATARSDIDFTELRKSRQTIYLCVTPDNIERFSHLLTIFVAQAAGAFLANIPTEDEPHGVTMLLDEFDQLGFMPLLAKSLTIFRSYNVRMVCILQDYEQLVDHYKTSRARTMFGNAKYRVYYTTQEQTTRENLSRDLGNKTVRHDRYSWSGGKRTRSEEHHAVPLMSATELRKMPKDDQIILVEGVNPIYCKGGRLMYFKSRGLSKRVGLPPADVPQLTPIQQPDIWGPMYKRLYAEKKTEEERRAEQERLRKAEERKGRAKKKTTKTSDHKEAADALLDEFMS